MARSSRGGNPDAVKVDVVESALASIDSVTERAGIADVSDVYDRVVSSPSDVAQDLGVPRPIDVQDRVERELDNVRRSIRR